MKKVLYPLVLLFVTILFFYKTFFLFQIPFPGDLLVSEYAPWKYESYLGFNPGSYPNKAQYFDVIRQLYPWKIMSIEMLKEGQFPFWNPYNFSGTPLFANNQSSVLNPFNLLFFLLPYTLSWSVYIIVQPFLASLFTYLYLRQLKLSREASIVGGIAYGFSLYMATFLEYGNIGHTILWLPLILFSIEKFITGNRYYGLVMPPVIGVIIFAGHLQIAVALLFFSFLYSIIRSFDNFKKIGVIVSLFLIGFGISAIQILPTMQLLNNSARISHPSSAISELFLLQLNQLILLFTPDIFGNPATRSYILTDTYPGNAIYVGTLPIVLTIFSFFNKKRSKVQNFFAGSIIVFLLFFIKNPLSEFIFNLEIFSASSPSNLFFLLSFNISVLAAFGLQLLIDKNRKIHLSLTITFLLFLFLTVINILSDIKINQRQLILGMGFVFLSGLSLFVYQIQRRKLILFTIIAFLILDLFYYFNKFNPFTPPSLFYPKTKIEQFLQKNQTFDRFLGYKAGDIESNFSTFLKLYSPDGYDPLYPKTYNKYTSSKQRSDVKLTLDQNQINELGVKFILDRVENGSDEKTFPPDQYTKIDGFGGWIVYENLNANPRAYIKSGNDKIAFPIVVYNPNEVVIKNPGASGTLVLTDNYYPGWKVFVDGKEKRIKVINGVFRGVDVSSMDKLIKFEYRPGSFYIGFILTIISMGVLGLYIIVFKYIWKKS